MVDVARGLVVAVVLLYVLLWGSEQLAQGFKVLFESLLVPVLGLVGGAVLHELIHGASWALLGRKSWRYIKFGFDWKTLIPYAHIQVPITARAYRWGAFMPGLVMGLVPCLVAMLTGSGWLLVAGAFFVLAAGGDFVVLWLLRGVPAGALVEDHPSAVGCRVVEPPAPQPASGESDTKGM